LTWKRSIKKGKGINSPFSVSAKLKKERKSSDEFEFMLNKLSLEEIIALKLEITARVLGGKYYGFQLWSAIPKVVKEALMLYAISASNTDPDAAELLNMPTTRFVMLKNVYKSREYFKQMLEEFKN
jgi:hypothetical protein